MRDTGIGLTEEQMARLFTSFSQADTSITRKYGGSGLGLTICQRLVDMMGGRIWVKSTPGVGSTFFFTAVFGTGQEADITRNIPPNLRGIKALVVDDNPSSREIFQRMLESFSFNVTLAASGEQGLREIEKATDKHPFDIVVMDWKLPGMDGIDAAIRIKKNTRLSRIPAIIIVSAYGREEILWRAEAAGLEDFLIKPIRSSVMFDTIMGALAKDTSKMQWQADAGEHGKDVLKDLKGVNVLLVEDNPINQQVAMEILASAGVIVSLAVNGQEAVDAVNMKHFDAVLMDVQMPVMDGYTATQTIRRDIRFKDLPIIAMTAHAMAGDHEKSIQAGMNDHITKPVDPEKLYAILNQWISARVSQVRKVQSRAVAEPVSHADSKPAGKDPFPDYLEGFDLVKGLGRLQGNKVLYRKLLINFADNYKDTAGKIQKALDAGEYQKAHKMIHDIKGLSGNLAAHKLQAGATELVHLVKHADTKHPPLADKITRAFSSFETFMNEALNSARNLKSLTVEPDQVPLPESPGNLAPELAQKAAQRLRGAVEMGDLSEVLAIAEQIVSQSKEFIPYQNKIAQLADNFDFEGILGLIDGLGTGT